MLQVFTRGASGGNRLGVVNDLSGLDDASMQEIATGLGYSETAFVDWPSGGIPFVRIFTPAEELPFAGHPLVGAAWCLAVLGPGDIDRIGFRGGTARVRNSQDMTWIDLEMFGNVVATGDVSEFVSRAGLTDVESVDRVMLPLEYVIVRLDSFAEVASLCPDFNVLSERFGTYVYARNGDRVRARFFAPATAVPEDPATGSAAIALATVLSSCGETTGRVHIEQGEEIGYPSRIELEWGEGRVAIGGTVIREEVRMLES